MSASAETQVPGCSASRPSSNRSRCPGIGTTWPVPAWAVPAWAVPAWAVLAWPAWTSSGPSQRTSMPPIIPDAAPAPCRATAAGRPRPRPDRARPLNLGVHAQAVTRAAGHAEHGPADLEAVPDPVLLAQARHVEHEVGAWLLQAAGTVGGGMLAAGCGVQRLPRDQVDGRVQSRPRRDALQPDRPAEQPGERVIGLGTNDARLAAGHGDDGRRAVGTGDGRRVAQARRCVGGDDRALTIAGDDRPPPVTHDTGVVEIDRRHGTGPQGLDRERVHAVDAADRLARHASYGTEVRGGVAARPGPDGCAGPHRSCSEPTGLIELVRDHTENMNLRNVDGPVWVTCGDKEKVLEHLGITETVLLVGELARCLADMPGAKY